MAAISPLAFFKSAPYIFENLSEQSSGYVDYFLTNVLLQLKYRRWFIYVNSTFKIAL